MSCPDSGSCAMLLRPLGTSSTPTARRRRRTCSPFGNAALPVLQCCQEMSDHSRLNTHSLSYLAHPTLIILFRSYLSRIWSLSACQMMLFSELFQWSVPSLSTIHQIIKTQFAHSSQVLHTDVRGSELSVEYNLFFVHSPSCFILSFSGVAVLIL